MLNDEGPRLNRGLFPRLRRLSKVSVFTVYAEITSIFLRDGVNKLNLVSPISPQTAVSTAIELEASSVVKRIYARMPNTGSINSNRVPLPGPTADPINHCDVFENNSIRTSPIVHRAVSMVESIFS